MGKVLFFDVDGTLTGYGGAVPESACRAIEKAKLNGHQIVVCTGRSIYQISPNLLELADGLVASTGGYVSYKDKVIYEYFFDKEKIEKISEVITKSGGYLSAQTESNAILDRACLDAIIDEFKKGDNCEARLKVFLGDYVETEEMSSFTNIKKFLYFNSQWKVKALAEALDGICHVETASYEKEERGNGEITGFGINKSYGMAKYIEYQNMTREDVIAFGDGPNDIDMLEFAGIGVAMGNAWECTKEVADFITKDVDDGGVEYAMLKLGLID